MPSAKAVASSGVTAISRSARMPTSVVVSAPSSERTVCSDAHSGGSPAWWSKTTFSTSGSSATDSSSPRRAGVRRLDDDQAADRADLEPRGLCELELVGVQAVELADVAVQRARQAGDRLRVETTRGEQRREGVEVGVAVSRDDGLCAHRPIVPPTHAGIRPGGQANGTDSSHSRDRHARLSDVRSPRGGGRANRTKTS